MRVRIENTMLFVQLEPQIFSYLGEYAEPDTEEETTSPQIKVVLNHHER